jgi:hypothetical protein
MSKVKGRNASNASKTNNMQLLEEILTNTIAHLK